MGGGGSGNHRGSAGITCRAAESCGPQLSDGSARRSRRRIRASRRAHADAVRRAVRGGRAPGPGAVDRHPECRHGGRGERHHHDHHVGLAVTGVPATTAGQRYSDLRQLRGAHASTCKPRRPPNTSPARRSMSAGRAPINGSSPTDPASGCARFTPTSCGTSNWPLMPKADARHCYPTRPVNRSDRAR